MKTKEQIAQYNKEYFSRPEVVARAKVRNAERRHVRKAYKQTERGKEAERRYLNGSKGKTTVKAGRLRNLYGLTPEEYNKMLSGRDGVCDICNKKSYRILHVDHCHATNVVRGMLCGNCNMALGLMKDNVEFLSSAIKYLLK